MTSPAPPESILVIKLGALGDFIQALGAMRAIRHHHPEARITLMTTAPFVALGRSCGYFDAIVIDRRPRWHDWRGWLALRRTLLSAGYKRVYDLQNSDRTALYLRMLGRRAPQWVGAARGASHRNADPGRTAGHALDGHVQTLALAGVAGVVPDDLSWMKADTGRFGLRTPYALIVPGCSAEHPEKRWPVAHYAALAAALSEGGVLPVLIGGETDGETIRAIARQAPGCVDLCGRTTLEDLPALARGAAAAIGNDTGPVHMAAATGCPTLALFGQGSDPARHTPKGACVTVLRAPDLAALEAQTVIAAVERLLRNRNTICEGSEGSLLHSRH